MKHKSFISCFQLSSSIDYKKLSKTIAFFSPESEQKINRRKVVGLLFDEPSSRTRFSVESAIYKLGANCITSLSIDQTSMAKDESIADSAKVWSRSCDLLCVRSRLAGFSLLLSQHASVPVINLGDGFLEHPSQGLSTALHAYKHFGFHKNLNVCIWGDVLYSRCAHSVLTILSLNGAKIWLYPIPSNEIPLEFINLIKYIKPNAQIHIISNFEDIKGEIHLLYVNRYQKERREDKTYNGKYRINIKDLRFLSNDGILLHPLPRGSELSDDVCNDPRSKIWEHLDFTYRTRSWLIYQYLSEDDTDQNIHFKESPFFFMGSCGRDDCASSIERSEMKYNQKHLYVFEKQCSLCYRTDTN